jgi:type I restriction enzyme S subunit
MWQGASGYSPYSGILSPAYTVISPKTGVSSLFFAYLIKRPQMVHLFEINSQGLTSDTWNLKFPAFSKIEASAPLDIDEQENISELFTVLDNLITLHQRKGKGSFYQVLLKILSSKMTIYWEQRKLGEIVEVCSGKDYKHLSEGDIPVYGTGGYMLSVSEALSYFNDAVGIGRKGTIDKPYILKAPFWTVDTLFYAVPKEKMALNFVYCLFQIIDWKSKDESTGVPSLSKVAINSVDIPIPKSKEQERIGAVFLKIDNLITLHQCKQNIMMTFKKYHFYVSVWRHKTITWEQRKLGELGKAQSGIGFPDKEQGGKKGIPFFKVSDMNNLGNELEMHLANNYVSLEQIKKNGWAPIEETSVIFAKVGAAIMLNRKRLVRFPFLLDNNTMAYKFNDAWEIDFGRTLFERIDLTSLVQVGALPSYNAGDVENMEVAIPQKAEQAKLGALFASLDNLITLHQRGKKYIGEIKNDKRTKTE